MIGSRRMDDGMGEGRSWDRATMIAASEEWKANDTVAKIYKIGTCLVRNKSTEEGDKLEGLSETAEKKWEGVEIMKEKLPNVEDWGPTRQHRWRKV